VLLNDTRGLGLSSNLVKVSARDNVKTFNFGYLPILTSSNFRWRGYFTVVGNNVNTWYKPEKFGQKLKLVNTQVNTHPKGIYMKAFTLSLTVPVKLW